MSDSLFSLVPEKVKGVRYFLQVGSKTKYLRGWRTKAEVNEWLTNLRPEWRVGYHFKVSGQGLCWIVTRNGQEVRQ